MSEQPNESMGRPESQNLIRSFKDKYPENLEGITALEQLTAFFEEEKEQLKYRGDQSPEALKLRESLIQYQMLVAHFIIANGHDRELLEDFWKVSEDVVNQLEYNDGINFKVFRFGILTQVAVYKIFEKIKKDPRTPHPREDLTYKIDLWADENTPIQIKGRTVGSKFKILNLDDTGMDAQRKRNEGISELLLRHLKRFKKNVTRPGSPFGDENAKGLLVAIPHDTFDLVTGEPSEEVMRVAKEYLGIQE
ncbi:hypothetical protein KW782_04660 [Candidatus Parcubacteria bacterium]|nr:hypothetical protein [Candidatus Parcubacteria bacterium]